MQDRLARPARRIRSRRKVVPAWVLSSQVAFFLMDVIIGREWRQAKAPRPLKGLNATVRDAGGTNLSTPK